MENKVEEPAVQYNFYSLQEYWDIEESTENKNEYYNGNLVVMQGASLSHNRIVTNLAISLGHKLKDKGCIMYFSDLRLSVSSANAYVYPDAMIICGKPGLTEDKFDTAKNPGVVFEILSKSTEANDRRKFFYYMQMASVKEIIMINSYEQVKVEVGSKQENGSWQITTYTSLQDEITLHTTEDKISLEDIYQGYLSNKNTFHLRSPIFMIQATIITIGDELLIGQVIDTNSAWMAQELNKAGIPVKRRVAVGDDWDAIWAALDEESQHADIILITGGLGPTADDITKPLLCKYFGGKLIIDEGARQNVINIFTRLNRPMIARNLLQAEVPDVCTVIQNKRGTAPGMWFEKTSPPSSAKGEGKVIFVSMPGVPHEMKGMMEDDVIPQLSKQFHLATIVHRTLLTAGVGESFLADLIQDFETALPAHIKLAYLPNYGMVRLRLTSSGYNKTEIENEIDAHFIQLQSLVKEYLVTNIDEPMETVVGKLLIANKQTLCTAESCTGGYIAHLLTSMPGSSAFFDGSVVSYSYSAKEDLLNVSHQTLITHGAVSEEVVIEMAKGALQNIKSSYTIAVSGIMGPGGGLPDKPVGTVWVAYGNADKLLTQKLHFRFDRTRNIQLTAVTTLNLLRKFILEEVHG